MNGFKWVAMLVVVGAGSAGWTLQSQSAPFDRSLVSKEIKVMEGIISTSLQETDTGPSGRAGHRFEYGSRDTAVQGFYLAGQGVVFTVPSPVRMASVDRLAELELELASVESGANPELLESRLMLAFSRAEEARQRLLHQYQTMAARLAADERLAALQKLQELPEPPEPPPPPPPPPAPPAPPSAEGEAPVISPAPRPEPDPRIRAERLARLRGDLERLRTNLGALKENAEEVSQRVEEELARIQDTLIEVAAKYGDTLSFLAPDEYLNFILAPRNFRGIELFGGGQEAGPIVLSVKKSDVNAYRSGAISLDQLRSRILRY